MKKILMIALYLLLCFSFVGCNKNDSLKPQDSETKQISENTELSDEKLAENVAKSLGVPDKDSIEYSVSREIYYFEAADRYYKNITFNENGEMVAHASVDPYNGELLRNIVEYNNPKNQNDVAKEALQRVLENEQAFTAQTGVSADETTEYTLEKYRFQTYDNAYYLFVPEQYAFVDMDNDNIEELVIMDSMMNHYLVLHYENEKINGYCIGVRSLIDLRTDGSFLTSSGAGINSIGNMCFDGIECKVINKALANDYDQEYFIDGEKTDQETSKKYFDDWNENTTKISWNTIN